MCYAYCIGESFILARCFRFFSHVHVLVRIFLSLLLSTFYFAQFPNIQGASTQDTNNFDLYEYFGDSWGIMFMHPGDFTPVCTTELGAAAKLEPEFAKRGVKLCGFSVNNATSHAGWIEDIKVATGQTVKFPLICDPHRDYAVGLGILDFTNRDSVGMPMTLRSVYILKPDKTIAAMITYPACLGRNFDEILRAVDGLQRGEAGVACPANWRPGNRCIVDFSLSDKAAEEKFGKGGVDIVDLPSEKGKEKLNKHYLRYTKDPHAD